MAELPESVYWRVRSARASPARASPARAACRPRRPPPAPLRGAALDPKPTIACVEWIDPPMIAGNWIPELESGAL